MPDLKIWPLNRRDVAHRSTRPGRVVVRAPSLDLRSCMLQTKNPTDVQAIRAESGIETLIVGTVAGFSWPGKVELEAIGISPEIEVPTDQFGAIAHGEVGMRANLAPSLFRIH